MSRGRRVGAVANYRAALRDIKRRRAKGLPVNPEYAAHIERAGPPGRPEATVRPWWADRDEEHMPEVPTHTTRPTYRGEPFKVTAEGLDGVRRVVAFTCLPEAMALEAYEPEAERLSYQGVKYEHVRNRKTGD